MENSKIPKLTNWTDRVKQVAAYHAGKLRENDKWRLQDTAADLNRSVGRISEDLMLASWMITDPKVERFEHASEAIDYVKRKRRDRKLNGLHGV